jgi:hypothetical protein
MNPIWRPMKKRSPSGGQNGQLDALLAAGSLWPSLWIIKLNV